MHPRFTDSEFQPARVSRLSAAWSGLTSETGKNADVVPIRS